MFIHFYFSTVVNKIDAQEDSFNHAIGDSKVLHEKGTHINQEVLATLCITKNKSSDNNTINRILTERAQIESLRKLSVTPICSINTYSNPLSSLPHENSIFSNSFFSRDESNKEIAVLDNLFPIPKQTFSVYTTTINVDHLKPKSLGMFRKHSPEERIEEFMKLMEQEINPLKHMLNNIIAKFCALDKVPNYFNNKVVRETIHAESIEEIKEIEESNEQLRSNRVVFNIVFDD